MQHGVIMKVLDLGIANEFISQQGSVFLDESNVVLARLQI
jgi:hypothetical protein